MTDATSNRFLGRGDTATMNAFVPNPATPASGPDQGYFWFNTDDNIVYGYDFVGVAWVNASGAGTVSTVSIVNANGVSGSVANPTTTPALTIRPNSINQALLGGI